MATDSLYDIFLAKDPKNRELVDRLAEAYNRRHELSGKDVISPQRAFYLHIITSPADRLRRLREKYKDPLLDEAEREDLERYLHSNEQALGVIDRYQRLAENLPLQQSERDTLVAGVVQWAMDTFDDAHKERYTASTVQQTIYRIPRLNLGVTTLPVGGGNPELHEAVSYDLRFFLGDGSSLKDELFARVFLRQLDRFRTPAEARTFLESMRRRLND